MALAWQLSLRFAFGESALHEREQIMIMQKAKGLALSAVVIGLGLASVQPAHAAEETPNYRPFSVSAEASTLGLGASASWRFHDHLAVRGGINYFGYSKDGEDIEGVRYNTDLTLLSAPLAVDFYPWVQKTFRVSVGVLVNQNEIEGVVPQDPVAGQTFVTLGSTAYDSSAIGSVNMTMEQSPISPFLSIGASVYLDDAKHWALNGELGVAYTGNPDVSLSNSGPGAVNPADLAAEAQQIEDWADKYQFLPIVKVSVSFSF
jgi:hypothetical protein